MEKNSKIFVAGHKGLVGSAILRKLQAEGYKNIITRTHEELDLLRQDKVETFFKEEKPEYVFLAAAKVGGILANSTYPAEFIYNNLIIQSNVIHSCYLFGIKKLLFLGSSCIYPRNCPQPMKEEYLLSSYLEPTNEPYAIAKIAGIKMCQAYNRQYGTKFISVMPTNIYGPNDNFDLRDSHVLPALIRKFHLAKLLESGNFDEIEKDFKKYPIGFGLDKTNEKWNKDSILYALSQLGILITSKSYIIVNVWGTGSPRREFLYVDDLADACLFLMKNYESDEIINIGIGKDLSIKELAEMIAKIVGFRGEIKFDTSKPDGTPQKLLDVSKLNNLGWKAKIELEEGIQQIYKWYLSQKIR